MWERLFDDFTTTRRMTPIAFLWIALIAIGALVLVFGAVFNAMTGQTSILAVSGILLLAFGVIAFTIGLRGGGSRGTSPNRACPKCSASPEGVVTANGFTKCARCGEPYFVF